MCRAFFPTSPESGTTCLPSTSSWVTRLTDTPQARRRATSTPLYTARWSKFVTPSCSTRGLVTGSRMRISRCSLRPRPSSARRAHQREIRLRPDRGRSRRRGHRCCELGRRQTSRENGCADARTVPRDRGRRRRCTSGRDPAIERGGAGTRPIRDLVRLRPRLRAARAGHRRR